MGHNSEITFTVTMFGSGVFQNNLIEGYILDTTDESLNKVKSHIENKYNISVYDFHVVHGIILAHTSNKNVDVSVEPTTLIV